MQTATIEPILYLTFLQYGGLADLLCSHCEFRLLLAGWYDGLEVVITFLESKMETLVTAEKMEIPKYNPVPKRSK